MGYSQELAVTMENGQQRPLRSSDLAQQTGMKKPNMDRGLTELEAAGLALRRPIDPSKPLQKGNIAIYSWAVPRDPDPNLVIPRDNQIPDWVPPSWTEPKSILRKFINRLRISLSPDFLPPRDYLSEVEAAARDYQQAEDCLAALLKLSGAGASAADTSLYETKGKEIKRKEPSSSAFPVTSPVVETEEPEHKAEEEEGVPYQTFKALYPPAHFDEGKTKPVFEALNREGKRRCLERLKQYLICDRWLSDHGRWIPLASNWIKAYDADPPPALKRHSAAGGDDDFFRRLAEKEALNGG
jgi:hypothetical protein